MSVVKPDDYIMKMDENTFNYLVNELELIHGRKDSDLHSGVFSFAII